MATLTTRMPSVTTLPPTQSRATSSPPHFALSSRTAARVSSQALSSAFPGSALRGRTGQAPPSVHHQRAPRTLTPRSMWIDNRAEVEAEIPVEEAFKMWEDRERIPRWMPWISSVKVQPNAPEMSRWTLRWEAFNQNIELTWLARNMQPTLNQKIHWRSVDGLPNRGIVRFFRTGKSSCKIEMTISYEVPDFLLPFATALGPLVENIIKSDLNRFAKYAKEHGHSLKELEAS